MIVLFRRGKHDSVSESRGAGGGKGVLNPIRGNIQGMNRVGRLETMTGHPKGRGLEARRVIVFTYIYRALCIYSRAQCERVANKRGNEICYAHIQRHAMSMDFRELNP